MIMHETTAHDLITGLQLVRHPEGGWFRETYRSSETVPAEALAERFTGSRAFSTVIYFLLESGDMSALHRIKSDEVWHFYAGSALLIHCIVPDGGYQALRLGYSGHPSGDAGGFPGSNHPFRAGGHRNHGGHLLQEGRPGSRDGDFRFSFTTRTGIAASLPQCSHSMP